ncbi:MAG: hypothetical protein H5T63_10520 [Chloroflexi bacterium]|nr:hypothetical protein [Chloroflexota bacterium]
MGHAEINRRSYLVAAVGAIMALRDGRRHGAGLDGEGALRDGGGCHHGIGGR